MIHRIVMAGLTISLATSVSAHHFFAPEYERELRGTISGQVTKVSYANPHVAVFVSVTDEDGGEEIWAANTVGPRSIAQRNWRPDSIGVGDYVTVEGFLGIDGIRRIWIQSIVLADGTILYPVGRELPDAN